MENLLEKNNEIRKLPVTTAILITEYTRQVNNWHWIAQHMEPSAI